MSTHRKIEISIFVLGLIGVLFSGYLSAVKFFTDTCAFNESCPYFLGFPACYFGFGIFLLIALFGGLHVFHLYDGKKANGHIIVLSVLGIFFAGYLTLQELPLLLRGGISPYIFGLPTCAYGLIVYATIALLAVRLHKDFVA